MTINTFKTGYTDKNGIVEPAFKEDLNFTCSFKGDYFEVSVYDVSANQLDVLKHKYLWIKEDVVDTPPLP